jgi:DNA-binding TFAR19-related protein (PDSD5 family)
MPDEDRELEMLRQRKLAELQAQKAQQEALQKEQEHIDEQKGLILRKILTKEALERLGNPELASSVENQLVMLYQSGRVQREIDDETLKKLLQQVAPRAKDIKITRK